MRLPLALTLAVALQLAPAQLTAGSWPQILGPQRNGRAGGEQLLQRWPDGGPPVLWTSAVGQGFAGPAVAGDRVVVFHRLGEKNRVEARSAATGKLLWKADLPARYRGGISPDLGPRCVPLIDADHDRVFLYTAGGDVHCVSLSSGRLIWSRPVRQEYGADDGYFGAGSTPILADGKLLLNVGAYRRKAGIVALAPETGKTVWAATEERASYSSPILIKRSGRPCVVFVTRLNTVCIDPRDGTVVFRFPFGQRGPTVNAAAPLVFDNHLFVTASYGIGAKLVRLDGQRVRTVWQSDEVISSQYASSVYHEGYLYGTDGREDVGRGRLRCVHAKTGKVQWTVDDFGVAHIILAGNKLLIWQVEGRLLLAEASPQRFVKLAEARIFDQGARALPALAGGRLLVRSNADPRGQLKCLLVGKDADR